MPDQSFTKLVVQIGLIPDLGLLSDLLEVVVDTSVHIPSMCTITFQERVDSKIILEHLDNALKYKVGENVVVGVSAANIVNGFLPESDMIFKGEITSIEPIFDKSGNVSLRIRAFDKAHRLTRGKKFRAFAMMNDTAMITAITGENGIAASVIDPSLALNVYTNMIQYDQSDWEFIWDRARLYGCQVYSDVTGLRIEKAGMINGKPIDLTWGEDLIQFEPRLVSMGQVTKTEVRSWDPMLKQPIVGVGAMSIPMSTILGSVIPGSVASAVFGSSKTDYMVDEPVDNVAKAQKMAQTLMDEHGNQYVRASGEVGICIPDLRAGKQVLVKNVGLRFSGTYYVTESRFIYRNGDCRIQFEVAGQNPNTLRYLLNGDDGSENKINGVVTALVTNNQDPMMMGRVKLTYPWMPLPPIQGDWARIASLGGGSGGGFFFMPEINDEVLVAFEHGDINSPYVVGILWNGKDRPPKGGAVVAGGKVNQRVIQSRSGHLIILDDTPGAEKIIIEDKTTRNSITIESTTNAMTIKAQGDLNIQAGGKLTLSSMADLTLDTKTKGAISAATTMEIKGNTGAKMAAGATSVIDLTVASSALKGNIVQVQGTGMTEITGGLVKIN